MWDIGGDKSLTFVADTKETHCRRQNILSATSFVLATNVGDTFGPILSADNVGQCEQHITWVVCQFNLGVWFICCPLQVPVKEKRISSQHAADIAACTKSFPLLRVKAW